MRSCSVHLHTTILRPPGDDSNRLVNPAPPSVSASGLFPQAHALTSANSSGSYTVFLSFEFNQREWSMKLLIELPRFFFGQPGALFVGAGQRFPFFIFADVQQQQESQREIGLA